MGERRLPSDNALRSSMREFESALAEVWLHDEGLSLAAERLGSILPGTNGFLYFRERDGSLGPMGLAIAGRRINAWHDFPLPTTRTELAPVVAYPLRGRYALAGRFINTAHTYGRDADKLAHYQDRVLGQNGLRNHLRTVFYSRGRMHAWFGVFGVRGDREFSSDEARVMDRLSPALRESERVAAIMHFGRAEPQALQRVLDAFEQPAWLVTPRGSVVHANACSRRLGRDGRIAAAAAAGSSSDERFHVSRVSIGRDVLALVVRRGFWGDSGSTARASLPPALARVAEQVAKGLPDKEISRVLNLPISTVRTYVERCFRRLDVSNRVELTRAWLR